LIASPIISVDPDILYISSDWQLSLALDFPKAIKLLISINLLFIEISDEVISFLDENLWLSMRPVSTVREEIEH